jgi:phosphoribosylamine--glycine ligase
LEKFSGELLMNVLVLGSGGREHAIAWKLSQSANIENVYVIPGNDGMKEDEKIDCFPYINPKEYSSLIQFVEERNVELTVVGPENLLADGVVDHFQAKNQKIIGPTQAASQIEASKVFAKDLMKKYEIPTAKYSSFEDAIAAKAFIEQVSWNGYVVKCDGLAAGKGVIVCDTKDEAMKAIDAFLVDDKLNIGNSKIVLEEKLEGPEVSAFALCDGENFVYLGDACDYKSLNENGKGPNTGGMGTYSPADWLSDTDREKIKSQIIQATIEGMKKEGRPFSGILFVGLMMTSTGPKVIEYNCRFGDPETQILLPRIESDLLDVFMKAAENKLDEIEIETSEQSGVHLVLASHGYPGTQGEAVRKGDKIEIEPFDGAKIFFAGVRKEGSSFVTAGGRVLGLSKLADSRVVAREEVYQLIKKIRFDGAQMRKDIGQ